MEYNKNQYSKANDKKVLHKVRKQWVVMSMALLMAIGGGAIATKTSAHAATTNNNGNNNTAVKANLNNKSAQSSHQNVENPSKVNTSSVSNQASALHNRIMQGNSNKVANSGQSTRNYVSGISHQFNGVNANNSKAVNNNNKVATPRATKVGATNNSQAGLHKYVSALNHAFSTPVGTQRKISNEPIVGSTYNNMEVSVIKIDGTKDKNGNYRIQSDGNGNLLSGVSDVSVSAGLHNGTGFSRNADSGYTYAQGDSASSYGGDIATMNSDGATWNQPSDWTNKDNYTPITLTGSNNEITSSDLNNIGNGKLAWDTNNHRPALIEKAGNAPKINVAYVDQSGKVIASKSISGQGNAGDTIDVTNPNEDGLALPNGSDYKINGSDIDTTYTFGSQGDQSQDVEIPVTGNKQIAQGDSNDKLTINYKIVANSNGNPLSSKTVSDIAKGHNFGDVITIDPKNYAPQGYVTDPNQSDLQLYLNDNGGKLQLEQVTGHNDNNGLQVAPLQNNSVTFNYDGGSHIGIAKDITVTYKTLDGTTIGTPNQKVTTNTGSGLNGVNSTSDFGNSINVTDASEQLKNDSKYVKGVAVPQGYHLEPGQDTNAVIDSDVQNLTYYVVGNQITTNSTQNYDLNIKPSTQIMNADGNKSGATKSYPDVSPKITAEVGQTFTLNPADYVPSSVASESGKDIEPENDKPITITVKSDGLYQNVTNDKGETTSQKITNPISITYDVYSQVAAQDEIRVHYIVYNPTNKTYSNQIYNMNTNKYQSDIVSDKGTKGNQLSPTNYLNNVPRGYQLYGIKDFNGQSDPKASDIKFGGSHGSDSKDDLDVAVIPNIGPVTVYYRNQNGKYVSQDGRIVDSTQGGNKLQPNFANYQNGVDQTNFSQDTYNSRFGTMVNLQSDSTDKIGIPKGYSAITTSSDAANGNGEQYVFNNAFYPTTYTVSIVGNQINPNNPYNEVKVNLHEEDPYGHATGKVVQVIDHLNERVGDTYSVDASAYTPDNFSVDDNHQTSINGTITPQGASTREADFYYKSQASTNTAALQPITVLFEHNGEQVGSRTIDPSDVNGGNDLYAGKEFNVETASYNDEKKTGWKLPDAPYALIANQNMNTSFSTTAQNPLILNVYNTQQSDSSEVLVRVHLREMNKSGSVSDAAPSYLTAVPETGTVGHAFTIKPSDSHLMPKGFEVDNTATDPTSQDSNITGKFTSTGYELTSGNNPTEYYLAKKSQSNPGNKPNPKRPSHGPHTGQAQPIWVSFINEANNNVVADNPINGYLNQNISDVAKAAGFDSSHYHLVDTPRLDYHITDQVQQVPLVVKANDPVNPRNNKDTGHTLPVYVQFENPSGAFSGQAVQEESPYISDNTSETIQPSDYYGMIPNNSDYTYDTSNGRDKATTVTNNHGTLNPSSITFYFKANSNSQDQNLQPIYVNYVNQHGVLVGHGTIKGNNMYMNESVNAQTGDSSNGVSGVSLPAGYRLTSSDATPNSPLDNFKISNNAQFKTVPVVGDAVSKSFTAHESFIDGTNNGHRVSQPVTVTLNGDVGDQITLNPRVSTSDGSDDLEDSGYAASDFEPLNIPQNNNITVNFGWDSTNNTGTITPSSVRGLEYEKNPTNNSKGKLAGPVQVNFVDQNGQSIDNGNYTQIANYLPLDKQVKDILNYTGTNGNNYTLNTPAGYKVDPTYSTSYTATTTQPAKFTVHMIGNKVGNSVELHITQKKINQDGSTTTVSPMLRKRVNQIASGLRIGDSFSIRAGQFPIYHYAPVNNTPMQFNIIANGEGRAELQPTNNALFFYKYIPSDEMNAGNIYVSFVNQKGKYLNSDGSLTGHNGADIRETTISGTDHAGDAAVIASDSRPLKLQGPNEAQFRAAQIPSGYHIVNNENVVYQFPQNDKHITLVVYGDSVNKTLSVNRRLVDQNGNFEKALGNESVHIIGNIGSDVTVGPKNYTDADNNTVNFDSDGKYAPTNSDADEAVSIIPGNNGQGDINPSSLTFNYVKPVVQSKPITVKFVNQDNQQVGQSFNLSGNVGSDVDVTDPAQGGKNVPSGYKLAQNAVTNYQYKNSAYTAIVKVVGNTENDHVKIYRVLTNADGTTTVNASDAKTPVTVRGETGDVETLYANNYKNGISNYTPDESKPTSQQVTITPSDGSTTPGTIIFYYKSTKHVSQPVTIRFINQHGVKVGNDVNETGNVGSDTNILTDIGGSVGSKTASSLPQGYQLTNAGANREVAFTNNQQIVTVGVTGNPISTSFKIYRYEENSDGEGQLNNDPVSINGRIGDVIHINPYDVSYINQSGALQNSDVVPSGYHAANGNQDLDVTINGNGSITPVNSIDYIYKKNYTAPDVGTINVHYVRSDTQGNINISGKKYSEVDMESDHGTNGSKFDVTPYEDDVPENVESQDYDLINHDNPSQSVIHDTTNGKFNNQVQDIYIEVAKQNNVIQL